MVVRTSSKDRSGDDPDVARDLAELVRLIPRVARGFKRGGPRTSRRFESLFQEGALGRRHRSVLLFLSGERSLSIGELADRIGLSAATTSLMVGELAREGIVVRTEDPADRRRTLVRLEGRYQRMIDAWKLKRLEPLRRTLQRLSPEARASFMEGWRILADEIDRDRSPNGTSGRPHGGSRL